MTAPLAPHIVRLKRRAEFLRAARDGEKCVASTLILQSCKRLPSDLTALDVLRVGFTATGKLGGAVVRNRIRRRLKVIADELLPQLGQPGHDYVVIGRQTALECPFDTLRRDMRYALEKLAKSKKAGSHVKAS